MNSNKPQRLSACEQDFDNIKAILDADGVIAYPTESVFGVGCDPHNEAAVMRLLKAKGRPLEKGLIVVAASMDQLRDWLGPLTDEQLSTLSSSWPGPTTWCVPAGPSVPAWIRGEHATVALRVSDHSTVVALCQVVGPLVSTSANLAGGAPLRTASDVEQVLGAELDAVIEGQVGELQSPTMIKSLVTGQILRR